MKKPNAKPTGERERKVKARLADGYSVERLIAAIHGCKASPHHQGKNDTGTKYEDLELICRDGKHVEMFEALAPVAPVPGWKKQGFETQEQYDAYVEERRKARAGSL